MAKKNRQSKQPRRAPKQQPEKQAAEGPPGVPEAATASSSPMPVSPSEGALSPVDKNDLPLLEEETEAVPEELELLTFNLGEEEYAVEIGVIQEITKSTEITHIPRIQSDIKGIVTLRGNVIPVFDMHARLGLAPFVKGPQNRFIICAAEKGMAAMLVDRVNDVARLMRHTLEATPAGVAATDAGFIKKIARYDNRLLILLDIEKALRIDRKE